MLMIRKFLIIAYLLLVSQFVSFAQLPEKGDWHSRVGIKDPAAVETLMKAVFSSPLYKNPSSKLSSADYINFYAAFKKLTDLAPYADYTFYSGTLSEVQVDNKTIYDRLLLSFPDTAMRLLILEDIIALGHNMVDHLDSINVVRNNSVNNLKSKDDTLSLPVAMVKYAHLYYKYEGNKNYCPERMYDRVQARENYAAAFKLMREKNIDPGNEIEGVYVNEYYRTCEDLYRSDEDKYYEQFLQDYLDIVQTCDNLLIPYYNVPDSLKNDPANTQYRQFQSYNYYTNHPAEGVKALFKNSGASERLNDYYLDQLKSHRKDNDYLNKAIYILLENGCANTEAFFSYCEASYAIKPTYLNCFGSALASKKYNMRQDMIKYFQEAYKLAENDLQRGTMAYQIGMAMNVPRPVDPATKKNYPKGSPEYTEWENNMMLASANLKQVIALQEVFQNSSSIDVRKYPADAAYALAQNMYRLVSSAMSVEVCDEAMQYAQLAMSAAPDKYNANAESLINNITNARAQIATLNKEQKAYEKRKKEYEAYLKKKKAEEDFWNQ